MTAIHRIKIAAVAIAAAFLVTYGAAFFGSAAFG